MAMTVALPLTFVLRSLRGRRLEMR